MNRTYFKAYKICHILQMTNFKRGVYDIQIYCVAIGEISLQLICFE